MKVPNYKIFLKIGSLYGKNDSAGRIIQLLKSSTRKCDRICVTKRSWSGWWNQPSKLQLTKQHQRGTRNLLVSTQNNGTRDHLYVRVLGNSYLLTHHQIRVTFIQVKSSEKLYLSFSIIFNLFISLSHQFRIERPIFTPKCRRKDILPTHNVSLTLKNIK